GLFRTEFLLIGDGTGYDEEASCELYRRVSLAFDGPVTIRTYDVGADKMVNDGGSPDRNPALGVRGIRFCMANKDLFRIQLRAVLRASAAKGNIRIMFPMISSPDEFDDALGFLECIKDELKAEKIPFDENLKVGSMIEVPSAAIMSDELARKCDFFSIGTNDLMQYTIAVDRTSEKLSYLTPPLHPAIARLVAMVCRNASGAGIETCICGEDAGSARLVPILTGLGPDSLSMAPLCIPSVVKAVRNTDSRKAFQYARKVLHAGSVKETEILTEESNAETGDSK
ncbi:MAG: putative PEP-binding protein, partial [Bullifex sp.]